MTLSILIPTYNRSLYLKKNLDLLNIFLDQGEFQSDVEIVVSNNCSSDDTNEIVLKFQEENKDKNIHYYIQKENIGLEKNALFVLKMAKGEFIMYVGDDDYIDFNYLKGVIENITKKRIHVIIPSIITVDTSGNEIKKGRDFGSPNSFHKAGFKNCLTNSWRGHQLTGLVLKREGLVSSYLMNEVNNIYLFIYFVAYSCLRGNTFHFTQYPVKVTEPGQQNKDWDYGEGGLLNDVFDNYKKLPVNYFQKTLLQLQIINKQPWRYRRYKKFGKKIFFKIIMNILLTKNSTLLFKLLFPLEMLWLSAKKRVWKLLNSYKFLQLRT